MVREKEHVLPLKGNMRGIQTLAVLAIALMAGLSITGVVLGDKLYPTEEFIQSFMTNDLVNLIIGVPVFIAALWLIGRGKVAGLMMLPGSMLYVIYNSLAYVFGRPFDLYSASHLALILVCAYGIYTIISSLDHSAIYARLAETIPAKFSGWVLSGFGALFFFRAVGVFAGSLFQAESIAVSEVGVLVADMVLSVLLVAGGVMLLRHRAMGVASGLGLLYAASMLFVGLIVLLVIQSVMSGATIPVVDILVVALMGSVCFIPFIRYLSACAKMG